MPEIRDGNQQYATSEVVPEEFRQLDQLNAWTDGAGNILSAINEHPEIDGASVRIGDEASEATVINQQQTSNMMFAPEPQVNNQLELQS